MWLPKEVEGEPNLGKRGEARKAFQESRRSHRKAGRGWPELQSLGAVENRVRNYRVKLGGPNGLFS